MFRLEYYNIANSLSKESTTVYAFQKSLALMVLLVEIASKVCCVGEFKNSLDAFYMYSSGLLFHCTMATPHKSHVTHPRGLTTHIQTCST